MISSKGNMLPALAKAGGSRRW